MKATHLKNKKTPSMTLVYQTKKISCCSYIMSPRSK